MKKLIGLLLLVSISPTFSQALPDYDPKHAQQMEAFINEGNDTSLRNRDEDTQKQMMDARANTKESLVHRVFGGDESLRIDQIDSEYGISLGSYSTAQDSAMIGVAYHFNTNVQNFSDLSSFEGTFSKKIRKVWLDFFVAKTTAKLEQMTDYNPNLQKPAINILDPERGESTDLLTAGLGLKYRTTYIQNLISSPAFFETVSAHLTYNQFDDTFQDDKFSGLGFKADFGVHRRLSQNFHFGAKLSYNLASVKMPQAFEGQSSSERSLLLRWMSLAIDIGFYF